MYGESLYAAVLQLLGQVFYYDVLRVPAKPRLHRNGHFDGVDHGARYLEHQRHVAQHACAGTLAGHLLHRTAEVKVYQVGLGLLNYPCRLGHRLCVAAVYLYAHGALVVADCQFADGALHFAHQRFRADELRINHSRAVAFAQPAETYVGDVLHRCEEQRARPELYVAYIHVACGLRTTAGCQPASTSAVILSQIFIKW